MKYRYKTNQVCSSYIDLELDGKTLKKVSFTNGCNGNLKGIASLVEGMNYDEIKDKLKGTTCGFRNTSCPDQLVLAIEEALEQYE